MRRISSLLLAALLILGFSPRAQADFIYTFTTTTSAGDGGSLSVTIDAPDISSGTISSANIASLSLQLTGTTDPFFGFTSTDKNDLQNTFSVDKTTGAFVLGTPLPDVMGSGSRTFMGDLWSETAEALSFPAIPPFSAGFTVMVTDTVTDLTIPATGSGTWTVTQQVAAVPAPSSFVLAGVGGFLVLALTLRRRPRSQEAPAPTA
jgi:hypothetical protein